MTVARKPPRPLKLIHTSDVHLESDTFGSGANGDHFRSKVRRAFSGVIEQVADDKQQVAALPIRAGSVMRR